MSKKIQTIVPDSIAKEIEKVVKEDRFVDQSEFIRHCIREYLNHRDLKINELEAVIAELDQTADDLLNDHAVESGKEILAIAAPLKAYLKKISKNENAKLFYANAGQRDRVKLLRQIISDLQKELNGSVPLKYIIKKANKSGLSKDTVEDMINKFKSAGEIVESANMQFRLV
ncbi:MAG TPA: ribbon-helix-helix domain-containing protein [Candidatus Methylomirabilis sp.]|nr:ribbon-helix-helix domain-containing protein [Candidatus Methylomirabilis sp.]